MIEKIEGLEKLKLLEDLSLFQNRIVVLEGLDE
jgi:Leucine-rich repeat (LRR) protein